MPVDATVAMDFRPSFSLPLSPDARAAKEQANALRKTVVMGFRPSFALPLSPDARAAKEQTNACLAAAVLLVQQCTHPRTGQTDARQRKSFIHIRFMQDG